MSPFSEMFAASVGKKGSAAHRQAEAAAPVLPLLRPADWGGVAAGTNGRRLFDAGPTAPGTPWVTLVSIKPGDASLIAPPAHRLEEVFKRPLPEVERYAINRLDDRMRIDPCFEMRTHAGLVLVAWEDFAASLVLHDGFTRGLHERFREPVLALPTCATLIAGAAEHVESIQTLSREVLASLDPSNALTMEFVSLVAGKPRWFKR